MEHFYCMDTDELEAVIKPKEVDFDTLSIEELNEYILELEKEIEKAKQYISSKGKDRLNAEELFKK